MSWVYTVKPSSGSSEADLRVRTFKDLALDENGDLALRVADDGSKHAYYVEGVDAIIQCYRIRLAFFLGEWFLDRRQGMPYVQKILVYDPDVVLIRSLFRKALLTVPGTKDVRELRLSIDRSTRRIRIEQLSTVLINNSVVTLTERPFVL